ncbi:MAG TPA: transposase [Candidatus Marinimicrobia bacterium]|nr:transposase [Candidatus Neomarinimicrobiota bacterium]
MELFGDQYRIDSTRLRKHDYSRGVYFVTICTKYQWHEFGEVVDKEMQLNNVGRIAEKYWQEIPDHFDNVILDEWTIMPNHVHGVIFIGTNSMDMGVETDVMSVETRHGASLQHCKQRKFGPLQKDSLSLIVNQFKGSVTRWCRKNNFNDFQWQPRFYDHIIRNREGLSQIRKYIRNNPRNWERDRNNQKGLYM